MSADKQLAGLMNTTISVKPVTGRAGGSETFGALVTGIPAYVEDINEYVTDGNGKDTLAKHYVATEYAVTFEHRIWLAGADTSDLAQSKRPLRVSRFNNPEVAVATVSHYEIKAG